MKVLHNGILIWIVFFAMRGNNVIIYLKQLKIILRLNKLPSRVAGTQNAITVISDAAKFKINMFVSDHILALRINP